MDWMENGVLESTLRELISNEHFNYRQAFKFGDKVELDFPAKGELRLSAPNARCHGRFTQIFRLGKIEQAILSQAAAYCNEHPL